jgi:HSP20 family protein
MHPVLRRGYLRPVSNGSCAGVKSEFETVLDRFFGNDGGSLAPVGTGLPFSVAEDEDHYYIEADLPGVSEADLEITVHKGFLQLKAERKADEGRKVLYNGRSFGKVERVLQLPDTVSTENVEAVLSNGVLKVTLNKAVEAKPKKINVRAS